MSFSQQLQSAKTADAASTAALIEMYKPLLINRSYLDGRFDEDLYQTQILILIRCAKLFLPWTNSMQPLDREEDRVYNEYRN